MIRVFYRVGNINKDREDSIQFTVKSLKDLPVVIDHFSKYPLLTQKRADYVLFKRVVDLMKRREHLTPEGLKKIVSLRAAMNNGLSEKQKAAFPDVVPVQRPLVEDQVPLRADPHWLAGFAAGEASFIVNVSKSSAYSTGMQVRLRFQLGQHSRDAELLTSFVKYLECGSVYKQTEDVVVFLVTRFSDINEKIIPFFSKYQIQGVKGLDFANFCKVAELIKTKAHLTASGLEQIQEIKAGMNSGRIS
jgi:hypothetical protein